ncbi:MAG: hypothetical protein ABI565_09635, partial [Vicinamibacteria bacterium]
MSVFKRVVSRVRDFFLEPEPKRPDPAPLAPPPKRARKKAVEKPDAFEWEPPNERHAQNASPAEFSSPLIPSSEGSSSEEAPRTQRPPAFSVRNFSTEELQRSSVLDIVETAVRIPTRPIPPLPPKVSEIPGLSNELLEQLENDHPAPRRTTAEREKTVEIAPLLVEEIPRPSVESLGFASILREAALRVDERELPPAANEPTKALVSAQTSQAESPSWTLATRSMAGIESVPPPFALDGNLATLLPTGGGPTAGVRRPVADDPTRTGEIDRPASLRYPGTPPSPQSDREVVGVNTGEIERNLAWGGLGPGPAPTSEPPRPLLSELTALADSRRAAPAPPPAEAARQTGPFSALLSRLPGPDEPDELPEPLPPSPPPQSPDR